MGENIPNGHVVNGDLPANGDVREVGDQHPLPDPAPFLSFSALKDRIRHHYEIASEYYFSLWGEHIHHGYFTSPNDTKEVAQRKLIQLLLEKSQLERGGKVLDVGCGIGGTGRYLAREMGCRVTGVTISGKQVEIAGRLSREEAAKFPSSVANVPGEEGLAGAARDEAMMNGSSASPSATKEVDVIRIGDGSVAFIELDAEKMGEYFSNAGKLGSFDCVWISEAMSHLPNKQLFFQNAHKLLRPGGKLVVADWFKREEVSEEEMERDIKVIEDGMLLPPLCAPSDYVGFAKAAGLKVFAESFDISKEVAKTWYDVLVLPF
jgi:tocopherol O-methyltransferase